MNVEVTMNNFTDTLKENIDKILDTNTLPGIVLAVQRILVQNNLNETEVARMLTTDILQCSSHTDAVQQIFKYMI